GTVSPTSAVTTNASGIAQVTTWTLGTTAGANTLTATSAGLTGSPVTFTATGTAGPATQIALNAGNNQTARTGTAVVVPPSVIVRDANNNVVSGVAVTFAVTGGGGTVVPTSPVTTNAGGIAQVTSWTLGTTAGTNTLTATATGLAGSPVTFTATGVATTVAITNQTGNYSVGKGPYTTGSVTFTGSAGTPRLYLLTLAARKEGGIPIAPTVTTAGVTWTLVTDVTMNEIPGCGTCTGSRRLSVYRTLMTSTTSASTAVDYGGDDTLLTDFTWTLDYVTGMATTGTNGSDAIIQTGSSVILNQNVSSITLTPGLNPILTGNATFAATTINGSFAFHAGSGYTLLLNNNEGNDLDTATEWKVTGTMTPSFTFNTGGATANICIIGIEIGVP
ncbi:MAG TPA: hypothetical protein VEH62_13720, partial [Gemmatimonadales bacterium]|nr:hypothetical protein [Gemmatimonadales bacterium]